MILYHPGKVIVVVDALSYKVGSALFKDDHHFTAVKFHQGGSSEGNKEGELEERKVQESG